MQFDLVQIWTTDTDISFTFVVILCCTSNEGSALSPSADEQVVDSWN